ncbi:MAG: hypothetical protein GY951_14595, partial [Psychromonas sp.]|nr:hypothetical protein [Psychromonas sp.]
MADSITQPHKTSGQNILRSIVLAIIFAVVGIFILVYQFFPQDEINLERGSVAPKDILAPHQIVYESDIETTEARERARNSISTIYSRPDT